jgi:hypothetical protein
MPLIKPASNPIMNMSNEIKWIGTVQGISHRDGSFGRG